MPTRSSIEWTQSTWNPVTGCSKISPGCAHCYAERMSRRLLGMGLPAYANGFRVTLQRPALEVPLRWKRPQIIFVNSMSDLFHPEVPDTYILEVFDIMRRASWHQYQILTKRPERLVAIDPVLDWLPNIWMGVSVESRQYLQRVDLLRACRANVRFLSLEPLLGPLANLDLDMIDWVIVGGESGPKARPMDPGWVAEIRDQCSHAGVPFFFKQWGGFNKKAAGRILDGRTWDEMPRSLPPESRSGTARRPAPSL